MRMAEACRLRIQAACLFAFLFALAVGPLSAQAVWGKAGTSTMMNASGFEMNYKWAPVSGWIGVGYSDGVSVGGYLQTRVAGYDLGAGDRYLPFTLSTDVFEKSRYFSSRGLFVHRENERDSWTAFGGATSGETSYNFYRSFVTENPVGGFIYSRKLTDRLSLQSFDTVQSKLTSIQGLQFALQENWLVSGSAGVGNGSHFASVASDYSRPRMQVTAGYTSVGQSFEVLKGATNLAPERVGANVRVRLQPSKRLQITGDHENFLSLGLPDSIQAAPVTLNSLSASSQWKGFRVGAAVGQSSSGTLSTHSESFSGARDITSRIGASASLLRFHTQDGLTTLTIGTVREKISPRLSLYEGISHSSNNNNLVWGVQIFSNRLTLNLENTVYYSPLAGAFNGKQYSQAWTVNVGLPLIRGIRVHADTYIDPTGKMRYTAWADGIGFSRGGEQIPQSATAAVTSIGSYVVRGRIQDTNGKPIWGIAVQVDGQSGFSDSNGEFFLRFPHADTYPVAVLPERSLNRTDYEVVTAPASATSQPEQNAAPIIIVLRPIVPRPTSK
jgi:hypothetical protein